MLRSPKLHDGKRKLIGFWSDSILPTARKKHIWKRNRFRSVPKTHALHTQPMGKICAVFRLIQDCENLQKENLPWQDLFYSIKLNVRLWIFITLQYFSSEFVAQNARMSAVISESNGKINEHKMNREYIEFSGFNTQTNS